MPSVVRSLFSPYASNQIYVVAKVGLCLRGGTACHFFPALAVFCNRGRNGVFFVHAWRVPVFISCTEEVRGRHHRAGEHCDLYWLHGSRSGE